MINLIQKKGWALSLCIMLFVFAWIIILVIIPQLFMLDFSFRNFDEATFSAGDQRGLQNYLYLISGSYDSLSGLNTLHIGVFVRTIFAAFFVTLLNLSVSYPLAYLIGKVFKGFHLRLMILGLISPFWINEILRAFSFRLLFGYEGIINDALLYIGLLGEPYDFINANVALYAGLTYAYLLLMVMPIFNSIESLDSNQIEAATDMGAPWWKIHSRIVVPHAKPGIASGCIMVFMLCAGSLATPQILGGTSSLWFTQVIERWMNASSNWPMGAAYSFAFLLVCVICVLVLLKIFKVDLGAFSK